MTWQHPAVSADALGAKPDPKTARDLRIALNQVLVRDLRRFCAVAEKALPEASRLALLAVDRVDPAERLNPHLFAIHQDLRAALVAQDKEVVLSLLGSVATIVRDNAQHRPVRLVRNRAGTGVDHAVSSVIFVSDEEKELIDSPPSPLAPEVFDTFAARAADGFGVLGRADPHLAGEADELMGELILVRGGPQGITSLKFFGGAQIRLPGDPDPARTTVYLAENLAHETSHLMMYAMMNVDPMLHNAELGRYGSPLRTDLRPLYGIFHATFVLARLTRLYGRLADESRRGFAADDVLGRTLEGIDVAALREKQRSLFFDGYRVLEDNGKFTDTGRRILDECRAMVDEQV
jgi:HEXXH motif-containing protein